MVGPEGLLLLLLEGAAKSRLKETSNLGLKVEGC